MFILTQYSHESLTTKVLGGGTQVLCARQTSDVSIHRMRFLPERTPGPKGQRRKGVVLVSCGLER